MPIKPSCLLGVKASVNAMFGVTVLSSVKIQLAVPPLPNAQLVPVNVTLML